MLDDINTSAVWLKEIPYRYLGLLLVAIFYLVEEMPTQLRISLHFAGCIAFTEPTCKIV